MSYTKATMLQKIQEQIPEANVLSIYIVKSGEFFEDQDKVCEDIINKIGKREFIVRSSSTMEDSESQSAAGKFETLLHVQPDIESLKNAVSQVYASYATDKDEEILVQPMLQDVIKSGVVFTADMETFSDYYIINYHEGNDTEAVTGGGTNRLKTFISYKFTPVSIEDDEISRLIEISKKIEDYLQNFALDIEFAISSSGKIHILQVRPIAKGEKGIYSFVDLRMPLNRIYKKIKKLSRKQPFLLGDTTCFGVMPDWNPAEIIGIRPKKLAISLYKELVTDQIWANQRYNYGYRDLTMHPLMISFCGVPYIDTRITFNSFIPQSLNIRIAEKLVNYYIKKLRECPIYHDKIEFDIVYSCYYFGISDRLQELKKEGFNSNEIKRIEFSLLELTNSIIHPIKGLYKKDIEAIYRLDKNYNIIVSSEISLVDKIYWLIEECKAYGTLPFAGVARAAFIAIQFLKSFVSMGIITNYEYDMYMNSLYTVNKQMTADVKKLKEGKLDKSQFLKKYGHIRPGTYDITIPRYDEDFEQYFDGWVENVSCDVEDFAFTDQQKKLIQIELEENGFRVDANELLTFIKEAIEGREFLKFIFTKSVSKILQYIEELGTRVSIAKEEMAHLDIMVVKQLYVDLYYNNIKDIIGDNILKNKQQFECVRQIKLPSIIVNPEDVYRFYMLGEEPNFITQKDIIAEVAILGDVVGDLEGKIVFIQSADPGYDFLFTKNIAGLITQFGGTNSHMAIRCAELGIPAVIGAGEQNYLRWSVQKKLNLNCAKKQVISI